jgi:phage FluMu protein Com
MQLSNPRPDLAVARCFKCRRVLFEIEGTLAGSGARIHKKCEGCGRMNLVPPRPLGSSARIGGSMEERAPTK